MIVRSRLGMPPIWREAKLGLEVASLLRDPIFKGRDVEEGHDQPVLLVPGFLAGDDSLGLMTAWLRRIGYRTRSAGIRWNVDCSAAAIDGLAVRLEQLVEKAGRRVVIIGQSRGGLFARSLAVRRPDIVSGIVTLGSAHLDPLAVHPLVRAQIWALGALGTLGAPGLFSSACMSGDCCAEVRRELESDFPEGVGFVSIYSRRDGIVDWRTCLDPAARCVEVDSSHCGMSAHPGAYRQIAKALPGLSEPARSPKPLPARRVQRMSASRRVRGCRTA